jgi:uncharacterized membrane protein YdjX (TVP38/TMEM64 family)
MTRGGVIAAMIDGDLTPEAKIDSLRAYFQSWGAAAPLLYVLIVIVEVVIAPLPGLMLYAPGGVIFGGLQGGLLSLLGNVLGAGIASRVGRSLGGATFSANLRARIERYEPLLERRGVWVIALLRVNPLTSSDLVSYAAGLSGVSTRQVMLGTLLGMAPLCLAQAYLAESLLEVFPALLYPMLALCLVYAVVVVVVIRRMGKKPATVIAEE